MRKLSMKARDELTNALARRYMVGAPDEKTRILDEFVAITGFHRKHAMRLLRSEVTGKAGNGRIGELGATLDPVRLLWQIRAHQQWVVEIANQPAAERKETAVLPLERFLAGLRTAWADADPQPAKKKPCP